MANACLVCLRSPKSNPDLSFHKFPTNPLLRNDWLKACGLLESDYGPYRRLCSRHFEHYCFTGNVKRYLKPKSIPTLHLTCIKQLAYNVPELQFKEHSVPDTCTSKFQSPSESNISSDSTLQKSKDLMEPGQSQVFKFPSDVANFHAVDDLRCALNYCKSCYVKCHNNEQVSFFEFPKNSFMCAIWVEKCNAKYLPTTDLTDLSKNYKLCSLHFEDKMFANFQKNRLFVHAIPSLFQNDSLTLPKKLIIIIQRDSENKMNKTLKDSVPRDHNYCNLKKDKPKIVNFNSSTDKSILSEKDKDYPGLKRISTKQMRKTLNDPVLGEHNYYNSSTEKKKSKQDIDYSGAKKPYTMVTDDVVGVEMETLVIEQEDSLFVKLKAQRNLIVLPKNWFCDVSYNSVKVPLAITFFTLNNSSIFSKRYLEKQLVLNQDSEITFFVNGKKVIPIDLGLKNYCKPLDILSLQNLIQKFDSINICQGISKKGLNNIRLNVFENTYRWWHPKCTNISADLESFLCYSCKILNTVLLKISDQKKYQQQKPLNNTFRKIINRNKLNLNIKKNNSVRFMKMSQLTSTFKKP
ncbi:Zinc finger, C2CH-type [Cinara cedri]|uniref:Zinc finger, C2CH-type n=1 Tax=Cinara cedri TaxID=506608 RepID=A0A5E4MQ26_9HEMI|nr:Zinc finger, C2CH-type [Cinara cedri]